MPAVRTNDVTDSEVVPSCNSEKPYRRSTRRKYSSPYESPSDSDKIVITSGDARLKRHREKSIESGCAVLEISSTSEEEESFNLAPELPSNAKFTEITICGVQLRPTVAFDTFWRFAAERKSIDDKRRVGEPSP